jgi:hypothetical protein
MVEQKDNGCVILAPWCQYFIELVKTTPAINHVIYHLKIAELHIMSYWVMNNCCAKIMIKRVMGVVIWNNGGNFGSRIYM